jgi:hypothetical protein
MEIYRHAIIYLRDVRVMLKNYIQNFFWLVRKEFLTVCLFGFPLCLSACKENKFLHFLHQNSGCYFKGHPEKKLCINTCWAFTSVRRHEHYNVHSIGQKSIALKFSKSRTGSDVRYSCHHNSSPHSRSFTALNSPFYLPQLWCHLVCKVTYPSR